MTARLDSGLLLDPAVMHVDLTDTDDTAEDDSADGCKLLALATVMGTLRFLAFVLVLTIIS